MSETKSTKQIQPEENAKKVMEESNISLTTLKSKLENDVQLKIAIIGAGNAGNQTINLAYREKFEVFAINSSMKDLSNTIVSETIPSFIVGNEARGAGKNREKAKLLFMENGKELFQKPRFMSTIQEADIVFIVGATGGGTGSMLVPKMTELLTKAFPRKIIIPYIIAPKNYESLTTFNNTLQCINEIEELKVPYYINDLEYYADVANDIAFEECGKHLVECIKVVAGRYLRMSKAQMIDENDMKTIVMEPGYQAIYIVDGITSSDLDKTTMQKMLIDKMKHSPSMQIQKDGIIRQMGVIINCPEDMMEVTKTGNYTELYDFLGGKSKGLFEHYAVTAGTTGQIIAILSGMTMPYNRISAYEKILEEDAVNQKREKDISLADAVANFGFLNSEVSDKLASNTAEDTGKLSSVLNDFFS